MSSHDSLEDLLRSLRSFNQANQQRDPPLVQAVNPQPVRDRQNSQNGSESSPVAENVSNKPVSSPSTRGPILLTSPRPCNQGAVKNESQKSPKTSTSGSKFEAKFRYFMYKCRWLHDRSHVNYKDKALVEKSWNDVSSGCKISVAQCKDKLKQVQKKYRRLERLSADKGSLSAPDMQFIKDWQFLPYRKRTATQRTRPTVSPTANQTQSPSTPRSVVQERSSERLPSSDSGIGMNNPMPDQSFADDLAAAMQEFSAAQKAEIKSECWRVIADVQKRALSL